MIIHFKIFKHSIIILVLIFLGCNKNSPVEPEIELSSLITEEMVQGINLDPGIRLDSLQLKDGRTWKFALSVPDAMEDENMPFVLALHWWEEEGEVYERYFNCLAEPGFRKLNAIIFAPEKGEEEFWEYNNYTVIITFLEYAKRHWTFDKTKIVVSGYSNGAISSWFFGINYPEIFSAAIPIAGKSNHNKKLKIPFYVIHGTNDELFPVEDAVERVQNLQELGSDIQISTALGLSHFSPCSYDFKIRESCDWLENEVWDE